MKSPKLNWILATLAVCSLAAQAGDFTHNGGQSVVIGGDVKVRDLVDAEECVWSKGAEFVSTLRHFYRIVNVIEEQNWLLSTELQRASERLIVCMSRKALRSIPAEQQDGFSGVQVPGAQNFELSQVAVRVGDTLYIDGVIFDRMDDVNRAYLFLHELMHEFVLSKSDLKGRIANMRAFVRYIYDIDMGVQKPDADLFHRVIQKYGVYVPASCHVSSSYGSSQSAFNDLNVPGLEWYQQVVKKVENISQQEQAYILRSTLECKRNDLFLLALKHDFLNSYVDPHIWSWANKQQRNAILQKAVEKKVPLYGSVRAAIYSYVHSGDTLVKQLIDQKVDPQLNATNVGLLGDVLSVGVSIATEYDGLNPADQAAMISRAKELFVLFNQEYQISARDASGWSFTLTMDGEQRIGRGKTSVASVYIELFRVLRNAQGFDATLERQVDGFNGTIHKYIKGRRGLSFCYQDRAKEMRAFYNELLSILSH